MKIKKSFCKLPEQILLIMHFDVYMPCKQGVYI